MKLISMTATFGKLNKAHLEPGEGLNLIYAPNEGGKSTWAAFWKAMLYGIDTRDRDKKGYLADKNHYQPWSGAPMAGEMRLEWKGRDITIRRGPRGNTPFGSFSAVYTGTEEPVPDLTAANCGEQLTGVGQAVFSRSAFLGAGGLSLTAAPELERRIAALVTTGEEEVSFSQVQSRLKAWQNQRKVNKSVGEIPRLEGELAQIQEEQTALKEASDQAAQLEEEVRALEGQRDQLQTEAHIHQALARSALEKEIAALVQQAHTLEEERARLQQEQALHAQLAKRALDLRYTQAQQALTSARQQLESLERESARYGAPPEKDLLKRAQGELQYLKVLDEEIKSGEEALEQAEEAYVQAQIAAQDKHFAGLTDEQAAQQVERQVRSGEQAQAKAKAWTLRGICSFVLSAAIVVFFQVYFSINVGVYPSAWWFSYGLPVLAVLLALFGVYALVRRKQGSHALRSVFDHYQVQSQEDLLALVRDYTARCQRCEEAAQQARTIRGTLNDRKARRENSWTDILHFVHTFAPEVQNEFGCSAALSRALNLEHELTSARDRVEERRRRLEDLAAQGGREADGTSVPSAPQHTPEETRQALEQVSRRWEQADQALNRARGKLSALGNAPDLPQPCPVPQRSPEETHQALEQVLLRLDGLRTRLNQAQGALKSMGDPAVLSARQEELSQSLARRTLEYDALELAMKTMAEANARLQERFSPELNRLAGEYLARLTDGQYQSVSLSRELEGSVRGREELLPHSALYLSRGTADQLYLAVRLAICCLCLPERPPIFLDDALTAFDERRLQAALKLLRELGQEQQLLLFSCHRREQALMKDVPGVTCLEL